MGFRISGVRCRAEGIGIRMEYRTLGALFFLLLLLLFLLLFLLLLPALLLLLLLLFAPLILRTAL